MRLCNVQAAYGTAPPLFSGLSLDIIAGEHTALVGANGSGKSTLLRLLQGELRPRPGPLQGKSIAWICRGKAETSALAAKEMARLVSPMQQRNYVRQGWKISGEEILLSGLDNAAMVYGEVSTAHYARAHQLAEQAGALHLLGMLAPAMSQGQLRLMLLLRALMSRPTLLLLDEPFDGLDAPARHDIGTALELAAAKGATIVLSAHRRQDIPSLIASAYRVEKGRLVPCSIHAERMEAPLSQCASPAQNLSPLCCALPHWKDVSPFVSALVSRPSPLLELKHVDVFIERKQVLHDINWRVEPGQQWRISGGNGAGKSTLLRLLYGEEFAAWGGSLAWCGKPWPGLEELHKAVGYVSDRLQDSYDYNISAQDVLVSGLRGSIGLYHEPDKTEREHARVWLERFGVASCAALPFLALSSGTARRVLLARALAASPPVLLLDEPCSGLDPEGRQLFFAALRHLVANGVTLFYVSHHQEKNDSLFTHELRLHKGRLV